MKLRQRARRVLEDSPTRVIGGVPELIGTDSTAVLAARVEVESRSLEAIANQIDEQLTEAHAELARHEAEWIGQLDDHRPYGTGARSGRRVCTTCRIGYDAAAQRMISAAWPCPPARRALRALGRDEMGLS